MRCGALPPSLAALVAGAIVAPSERSPCRDVGRCGRRVRRRLAAQPRHPVYLIYDGFLRNVDGSLTLAFGYYNLNRVEVTVADDDNAFLPGTADRNQPTVFLPGRQRFACVMVVPEAFDGRLQWQVRFAGHESVTTARVLNPLYALEEASARAGGRGYRNGRGAAAGPAWNRKRRANDGSHPGILLATHRPGRRNFGVCPTSRTSSRRLRVCLRTILRHSGLGSPNSTPRSGTSR